MFTAMLDNVNFATPVRSGTKGAINTSTGSSQNPAHGFPKVLQPVSSEMHVEVANPNEYFS